VSSGWAAAVKRGPLVVTIANPPPPPNPANLQLALCQPQVSQSLAVPEEPSSNQSSSVPLGIRAMLARPQPQEQTALANVLPEMPQPSIDDEAALASVAAEFADYSELEFLKVIEAAEEELRLAEEAAKTKALATLAPRTFGAAAAATIEHEPVLTGGPVKGEEDARRIQELNIALQAQLQQQATFQAQLRSYESQYSAKIEKEEVTRFKSGYRPMKLCKFGAIGECMRGEACKFAHTYSELHPASLDLPRQEEPEVSGVGVLSEQDTDHLLNGEPQYQMKKKREICHRMSKSGCLLGKKCMFAHKESEIGTVELVIVDDRVKTRICRFWELNKCSYGKFCVNAHGMHEVGKLKPPEELCPARF